MTYSILLRPAAERHCCATGEKDGSFPPKYALASTRLSWPWRMSPDLTM